MALWSPALDGRRRFQSRLGVRRYSASCIQFAWFPCLHLYSVKHDFATGCCGVTSFHSRISPLTWFELQSAVLDVSLFHPTALFHTRFCHTTSYLLCCIVPIFTTVPASSPRSPVTNIIGNCSLAYVSYPKFLTTQEPNL